MHNIKDLLDQVDPQTSAISQSPSDTLRNESNELTELEQDRAARELKLALLVQESRITCGWPYLETDDLLAQVNAWSRLLGDLSVDDLDAAYQRAITEHCRRSSMKTQPFAAPHILAAYRDIQRERRREKERMTHQTYTERAIARSERVSFDELLQMLEEAKRVA